MRLNATVDDATRVRLGAVAAVCVLFLLVGPVIVSQIGLPGVLNAGTGINTFFEQYRRHEPVALAILAIFAIGIAIAAARWLPDESVVRDLPDSWTWSASRLWMLAGAVFVVAAVGTSAVMHALPLSMDEYVAAFQARVFASGRMFATIPDPWRPFGGALTPVYVAYQPSQHLWSSQYLPMYSALRAAFVTIGADRFLNPALGAVSLPLVYGCARRLWPDDRRRAWLAVGLLGTSSQLLFMSMSGYAMPAHLAMNLLWLYAFLRQDRAGLIVAPLLGAVALGLHNPFPHALFVAPFLVHLVWTRRWAWSAYYAAVYLAGIAGWYWWAASVGMGGGQGPLSAFQMPGLLMLLVQTLSLTVMLSWQSPLMAVAVVLAAISWRTLTTTERLLGAGVLLSFGFFFAFPSTQGHGWGYRYTFSVLGNMALVAVPAVDAIAHSLGRAFVVRAIVASALVTVFVQIPVRAWQVERYVRPFALAHERIRQTDADVVIVDPTTSWYGIDLIRNDPSFEQKPKVMSAFALPRVQKHELKAMFGDRVQLLEADELARMGIPTFPSRFVQRVWPPEPLASR